MAEVGGHTIGVSGSKIEDWTGRISDISAYSPKNLVIHLGVNDMARQDGDSCATEMSEFIASLTSALPNTKIFVVNISNNNGYTDRHAQYEIFNAKIATLLAGVDNVQIIDFASAQKANANVWAGNGFDKIYGGSGTHLTDEAYVTFAQMIVDAIKSANA